MQEPLWLTIEILHEIHHEQLDAHGGAAGLRDAGLLDSALNRPKQAYFYGQANIVELAALYSHALVKNHPYVDGNKRTAFVAGAMFLELNGYRFTATESEATIAVLDLAAGKMDENGFAAWLGDNVEERES